jgi:hypothetical protein
MALVVFESRVNMLTVATPSVGGYVLAYDSADGILKQKNDQGVITPIAGSSSPGSLVQTLAIGNNTGAYSINLGANTKIGSGMGGGQLRLDNGVGGANIVNLSTDYGLLAQSFLFMSSNSLTLKSVNASLVLNSTSASFQLNTSNIMSFNSTGCFINLGGRRVLFLTTGTSSTDSGNKAGVIVSSSISRLGNGVFNTVVLGGNNIIGATSNSVYVPNLYVKDGGFVKGTDGVGQLTFNYQNEVFLTSNTNIIGILEANSAVMSVYNGIFITDNIDTIITNTITSNTFISTSNTSVDSGLTNVVVIGGSGLYVTQSNTTYIGGSVSIGNSYLLPNSDGSLGQVIQTDGAGNTFWGSSGGSVIEITAASFSALVGTFDSNTTYKILDADASLYDGTEIYLTTNASGVLNETGVGKFYNPKYDQTLTGFGIFKEVSYLTGTSVFWGGKAWIRNSTAYLSFPNPAIDLFTLDTTYWDVVAYDDPFTQFYYNVAYDDIKYDWENDLIIYRNENNTNIVSSSVDDVAVWLENNHNPIKVFQWGNVYTSLASKGIGNNIITNSYNENINFRGSHQLNLIFNNRSYQTNLTFDNGSYQNNLTFDNSSYQDNLTFNNDSTQSNLTFDNASSQYNLTFDNNSTQSNLTFDNSTQSNLTFDNNSSQNYLTFDKGSYQNNLTFDNASYQENLTFDKGSYQDDLTFDNNSYQENLTFDKGSYQENLTFDNNSYQENLTFDNGSYQNNLMFTITTYQSYLKFDNASSQSNLDFFTGCDQTYLTFNNTSYQEGLTFSYDGSQNNLTFNNSYQTQLTFTNNTQGYITLENSNQTNLEENQFNIKLENSSQANLENTQYNLTLTGSNLSYQTPFGETDKAIGEVVFFGTASTLDPGYIYQFTTGVWKKADLVTGASASGLLAIALGTVISDGLLLRGYATFDYSPYGAMTIGSKLYLYNSGTFNQTPTTTTGEIVRIIGYCIDEPVSGAGTLYFCPDTTWIEIA